MEKVILRLLLIAFILVIASMACVGGVDNSDQISQNNVEHPSIKGTQAVSATATFGAEKLQIQLTAIAEQRSP